MKIAVLSDIHDNIWNLEKALKIVGDEKCEAIIFCGDFCAPFVPPYLVGTGLPVYAVFGNNDGDQWGIVNRVGADKMKVFPWSEEVAEIELGGKRIAVFHYPKPARGLATTGNYDVVFYGHDHKAYKGMVGKTLLANPGAICGIQKGASGKATFGIYETRSNSFKLVEIK